MIGRNCDDNSRRADFLCPIWKQSAPVAMQWVDPSPGEYSPRIIPGFMIATKEFRGLNG